MFFLFFREALEIQVYPELLGNQENQGIQEIQYVLNNELHINGYMTVFREDQGHFRFQFRFDI